jgi:hypothetical protein
MGAAAVAFTKELAMLIPPIPGIDEPPDDATVWQYMDFTKLVSILSERNYSLSE